MEAHLIPNTPEWLEWRKDKIGASSLSIIMGFNPWKTPYTLWCEMLGIKEPEPTNERMQRGTYFEPIARDCYCKITGLDMSPKVVIHPDFPKFFSSLDGIDTKGKKIVEIKCGGKKLLDNALKKIVPDYYNAQMQWQMYVTGLDSCDYFVYTPESHCLITVERDEPLISEMVQKAEEFLEMLRTLTAPPLCDKDYIDRSEDLYLEELLKGYKSSSKLAKQYKSLEDDYKKKIIHYCQEQSTKCGDYRVTRYLQKGRVEYDKIPELQLVDLEIYRKPLSTCYRIS